MSKVPPLVMVMAFTTLSVLEPRVTVVLPGMVRLRPSVTGPPLIEKVPLAMVVVPELSTVESERGDGYARAERPNRRAVDDDGAGAGSEDAADAECVIAVVEAKGRAGLDVEAAAVRDGGDAGEAQRTSLHGKRAVGDGHRHSHDDGARPHGLLQSAGAVERSADGGSEGAG